MLHWNSILMKMNLIVIICVLAVLEIVTSSGAIDDRDLASFDFSSNDERILAAYSREELIAMYKRGDPRVIRRKLTHLPTRKPTNKPKPTPAKPTPAKPTPAKPTPAKPTPAKPTPAKPTPVPPTPKLVYRELFGDGNCGEGINLYIAFYNQC